MFFLGGGWDLVLDILMQVVKGKGHVSQLCGFVQVTHSPELWISHL